MLSVVIETAKSASLMLSGFSSMITQVLAGPRKKFILACVAAGLITAMAVSQLRYRGHLHGPAPRDRVIFVTLDTTRADHVSAYGYARKTTPRFDARAAAGALRTSTSASSAATILVKLIWPAPQKPWKRRRACIG